MIKVDGFKNLPEGKWFVKFENDRLAGGYGIMNVHINDDGIVFATCGNFFAFDLPEVTHYSPIPVDRLGDVCDVAVQAVALLDLMFYDEHQPTRSDIEELKQRLKGD